MNGSRSYYPSLPFLPRRSVRLPGQDEEISDSPETGVAIANLRLYSYRLLSPRPHSRFHVLFLPSKMSSFEVISSRFLDAKSETGTLDSWVQLDMSLDKRKWIRVSDPAFLWSTIPSQVLFFYQIIC